MRSLANALVYSDTPAKAFIRAHIFGESGMLLNSFEFLQRRFVIRISSGNQRCYSFLGKFDVGLRHTRTKTLLEKRYG